MKLIPYVVASIVIWLVTRFVLGGLVDEPGHIVLEWLIVRTLGIGLFAWITTLRMGGAERGKGHWVIAIAWLSVLPLPLLPLIAFIGALCYPLAARPAVVAARVASPPEVAPAAADDAAAEEALDLNTLVVDGGSAGAKGERSGSTEAGQQ